MYSMNIQNKKLRLVDTMLFNGGLVKLTFGSSYNDQLEVSFFTDCPQGAEELANFLIKWRDKWHNTIPNSQPTARPSVDDDIPF